MFRPWLSALAWLLVVGMVRVFWLGDIQPSWLLVDAAWAEGVRKIGLWIVPPLLFLIVVGRQSPGRAWRELGLGSPAYAGYAFGLIATTPMAVALLFTPRLEAPDLDALAGTVALGPVAEEVLFRGFLLAFLVRRAGWSLTTALIVTSLAFALAHVREGYQPGGLERIPEILLISAGGMLFGWVYYRWGNLWHAIGLHACFNLWWELTSGHAVSAIAGTGATTISAAHVASIALAVLITVKWTSQRRE